MKAHYVYVHRRASDGSIFYVGKGRDRRAWSRSGRNKWWHHVVEKHGFTVHVVKDGMSEPCALALERIQIATIGKAGLTNLVDGGGGTTGWRHSCDVKERIGSFHRGKPKKPEAIERTRAAHLGKVIPPDVRQKMSLAKKGRPGRRMSEETRAKISTSHTGMKHTEAAKAKMSASHPRRHGSQSPSYDHTARHFIHPDHGEFSGTRGELMSKYSLSAGCISELIAGNRRTVKGWRIRND